AGTATPQHHIRATYRPRNLANPQPRHPATSPPRRFQIHILVNSHPCTRMYTPAAMASDLVTLFQALGDRTRLRLLNLLAGGELCVCYFVALLGAAQPKISRHLAYLRRSGLVEARRDGKWMHYRLVPPSDPHVA